MRDIALDGLVDAERGIVRGDVFVDPGIAAAENERLFPRCWLYVGHRSQLARRGDFLTTFMGADAVLVTRGTDDEIRVMLNSCRHRGMGVCRADSGNATMFTCPFHGWTYDSAGALVNVPNREDGYGDAFDPGRWGLVEVPRVETYKGLIFATFDPDLPGLVEYFGDMAWYLDCLLDRREGGTELVGGVHKIRMHGNWKLVAEQFAGDNYHAVMTHASAPPSWTEPDAPAPPRFGASMAAAGRQFASPLGHGTAGFFLSDRALVGALATMGDDHRRVAEYYEETNAEVANRLGAERSRGPSSTAGCVFPNFIYLAAVFGSSSIGVAHPKGADHFELWRWGIVDAAAPADVKAAMVRCLHVWPLGLADADDGENWSGVQSALSGPISRRQQLNYQMGLGEEGSDPTYPGSITPRPMGEAPQRAFYRRWHELMSESGPLTGWD